jgi:ABC-2 type transport system ATP-binding protein
VTATKTATTAAATATAAPATATTATATATATPATATAATATAPAATGTAPTPPATADQPSAAGSAIELCGLTKRYGDWTAVDGLDLTIATGEVFGLLGPNGAGKTTTILMLLGLTEPSGGQVRVAGLDPTRDPLGVKRIVGYLPDNVGFYDELTGRQNLRYTAELNRIPRQKAEEAISRLLDRVGLTEAADKKVAAYSRGMRQRLGLADVLLKEPRIVILDEPTLGLDPEGAREFLGLIRDLAREGRTVLLSSHLLHQVQQICDRVGIFVRGKMIACGRVHELADQVLAEEAFTLSVEVQPHTAELERALAAITGVVAVEVGEDGRLHITSTRDVRAEVGRLVHAHGAVLLHLNQAGRSLDDIYRRYFRTEEDRRDKAARASSRGVA